MCHTSARKADFASRTTSFSLCKHYNYISVPYTHTHTHVYLHTKIIKIYKLCVRSRVRQGHGGAWLITTGYKNIIYDAHTRNLRVRCTYIIQTSWVPIMYNDIAITTVLLQMYNNITYVLYRGFASRRQVICRYTVQVLKL